MPHRTEEIRKNSQRNINQTLLKHLPEFTKYLPSDKKQKYTPNMWLNHYVMTIDKEINSGS